MSPQPTYLAATLFFTLSLSSAALADTYCYYDSSVRSRPYPDHRVRLTFHISFNDLVCRNSLSIGARIAIAVATFVVVSAILLAYTMQRRRRIAQANLAYVQASQNQQQGYPAPPQGGFSGMPFGGEGQKPQPGYGPQQDNGQYNPQSNGQYDPQYNGQPGQQYNGQHDPRYNVPQYPPATYDQGNPNQPVSATPGISVLLFTPCLVGAPVPWLCAVATPSILRKPHITCGKLVRFDAQMYYNPPCNSASVICLLRLGIYWTSILTAMTIHAIATYGDNLSPAENASELYPACSLRQRPHLSGLTSRTNPRS